MQASDRGPASVRYGERWSGVNATSSIIDGRSKHRIRLESQAPRSTCRRSNLLDPDFFRDEPRFLGCCQRAGGSYSDRSKAFVAASQHLQPSAAIQAVMAAAGKGVMRATREFQSHEPVIWPKVSGLPR